MEANKCDSVKIAGDTLREFKRFIKSNKKTEMAKKKEHFSLAFHNKQGN